MRLFLVIFIFTGSLLAQDDSIIKLFPGKWKMTVEEADKYFGKADIFEEWEVVNENELVGTSYNINLGTDEKYVSEILFLKKFENIWVYVAIPKNQTITLFALKEFTLNKFIFENKEHDFPQRIIYEFSPDGKLLAVVEGEVEGKIRREEFSFILVKN